MLQSLGSFSHLHRLVGLCLTLVLVACGGGGSEELETHGAVVAGASSDVVPAAETSGSSAMTRTSCIGMRDRQAALEAINAARAVGRSCGSKSFAPAQALQWNFVLEEVAAAHSYDMIERKFFAHMNPDGNKAGVRFFNAGYDWSTYGENLGKGHVDLGQVMKEWLNSPTHCENLMDPLYKDFALVCSADLSDARQTLYWTQLFGAKK